MASGGAAVDRGRSGRSSAEFAARQTERHHSPARYHFRTALRLAPATDAPCRRKSCHDLVIRHSRHRASRASTWCRSRRRIRRRRLDAFGKIIGAGAAAAVLVMRGLIEIVLPGGTSVRVDAQVDDRALRCVLGALARAMITPPRARACILPAVHGHAQGSARLLPCWCSRRSA